MALSHRPALSRRYVLTFRHAHLWDTTLLDLADGPHCGSDGVEAVPET